MTSTFERVRDLMAKEFHLDPAMIQPDTPLVDLGVDSLAALEFAFELEESFHVTLAPRTDLRGGRVDDVVAAVDAALAAAAADTPTG